MFVLHPNRGTLLEPGMVLAVLAYALAANACYTLGWMAEVLARALWGREAPDMGPLLFREGLIFSVGLTLFPLLVAVLVTVARTIFLLVT
jgi:hypothetical protein